MIRKSSLLAIAFFIGMLAMRADNVPPTLMTVPLKMGAVTINAEVATTEVEKQRGLMFRRRLDDNGGMLFVFPREDRVSFWMKNTNIPLSVAFISKEGVILQIADMEPHNETPIYSESAVVIYALEVNQKWFDLNHVKPGDRIVPVGKTWRELEILTSSKQ